MKHCRNSSFRMISHSLFHCCIDIQLFNTLHFHMITGYSDQICIRFFRFLRPERKFGSLEELRTQIAKDIAYMQHS